MTEFQSPGEGAQEADRMDRAEDVPAAKVAAGEESPGGASVVDETRLADLVADVTLAERVTRTPAGLTVLQTATCSGSTR